MCVSAEVLGLDSSTIKEKKNGVKCVCVCVHVCVHALYVHAVFFC